MSVPSVIPGASTPTLPLTGIDAHWLLSFQREKPDRTPVDGTVTELSSDDYIGEIEATLPSGLQPGSYRFVIRGLSDNDYGKINLSDDGFMRVTLYLYWADGSANPLLAYAQSALGIGTSLPSASLPQSARTAVLAVQKVERAAGTLTYDVTITARERTYDLLARATVGGTGISGTAFGPMFDTLLQRVHFTSADYTYESVDTEPAKTSTFRTGGSALATVVGLESRLENACTGKHGRGMFLQRQGNLHVGARAIPFGGADPIAIDEAGGLIEIKLTARVPADANAPSGGATASGATPGDGTQHPQYTLTCKGRPDVRPGDVVTFTPQPQDVSHTQGGGLVGAIASVASSLGAPVPSGTPVTMYVDSVAHALRRADGFSTTIAGTAIPDEDHAWDTYSITRQGAPRPQAASAAATVEARASNAVRAVVRDAATASTGPDVGEVRAVSLDGDDALTLTVWQGAAAAQNDAEPNASRRLDVERPSPAPHVGVPYLTPFAWTTCGLVLPQYPGSRVLIGDRLADSNDPVAYGSLWQSGHVPSSVKPGDWWLILPVGVDQRESVSDDWTPSDFAGNATNDLIDGDGARSIGTKTLVLQAGDLTSVGTRPAAIDDGAALKIAFSGGGNTASIVLNSNGSIAITSSADISFEAKGNISFKAANVTVTVDGTMDVSKA